MHNQYLSCSALNSAGVTEDLMPLSIACTVFFATILLSVFHQRRFVSIIDSPEFRSFPAPYTLVALSDPLLLSCDVDSNPPANILWTKNGEYVGGGSQYQIPEVRENDYAVYACIATLGGQFTKIFASTKVLPPGIVRLRSFATETHLLGLGPPRFYPPQPVLTSKQSEVMLKCQLEKDTEPIVDWRW